MDIFPTAALSSFFPSSPLYILPNQTSVPYWSGTSLCSFPTYCSATVPVVSKNGDMSHSPKLQNSFKELHGSSKKMGETGGHHGIGIINVGQLVIALSKEVDELKTKVERHNPIDTVLKQLLQLKVAYVSFCCLIFRRFEKFPIAFK